MTMLQPIACQIAAIGAGPGGIRMGIHLLNVELTDFVILEKASSARGASSLRGPTT